MIPKNTTFYKPKLSDVLGYHKTDVALEINCHAIGTIQTFNPTNQTATATINYQKVVNQLNDQTGIFGPVLVAYPQVVDCPVQFSFGGAGGFTTPPLPGDECLVLFNDRDMDAWYVGKQNQAPNTARLHSFADAIIMVGIKSLPNSIQNFDASRPALRNFSGDAYVAVATKIELTANGKNLNTVLQNLVSVLQSLTVNVGTGVPNPPFVTNLATVASDLGDLLE